VGFRFGVVWWRSEFRFIKVCDWLYLVEGLLVVILDIDEVIVIIWFSDDFEVVRIWLI